MKMLEHQETPGFGAKLAEDSYGAGYVGKTASDYTEVDGISGATVTPKHIKKRWVRLLNCIAQPLETMWKFLK